MATSLKLMDNSKKGSRIRGLTQETAKAWHVSLLGMVDLTKTFLLNGMKYVCLGKISSDGLEGEYGVIRQLNGGNYNISAEEVMNSLSMRRIKLYHKLEMHEDMILSKTPPICCRSLRDKDRDLEVLDDCIQNASREIINLLHLWLCVV